MTLTTSSRKRNLSEESEYLPVTKRLNGLHIDVIPVGLNDSLIGRHLDPNEDTNGVYSHQNQSLNPLVNSNLNANCVQNHCLTEMSVYSPELDSNSNPIYYESNRVLFEAHVQRLQRLATNSRQHSKT